MRQYRGKRIDNGEWVKGWYVRDDFVDKDTAALHYIIPESACLKIYRPINWNRVIPETVGQSTDLKDKNGKEAYFGDLEQFQTHTGMFEIRWDSIKCRIFLHKLDKEGTSHFLPAEMIQVGKIIGNIHEK